LSGISPITFIACYTARLQRVQQRGSYDGNPLLSGNCSTQMVGAQEPEETLSSPVISIYSNFIFPCPRRHLSSTWWLNGNNCPTSVSLCEGEETGNSHRYYTRGLVCATGCAWRVPGPTYFWEWVFAELCSPLWRATRIVSHGKSWTFNLPYAPSSILPLTFCPSLPIVSASSRHRCWKGTPETGDKS